jgi:hypothetical protein
LTPPATLHALRRLPLKSFITTSLEVGKYLISSLAKRLPDDRYAASVSIKSGRGSQTHDRVMRLPLVFDTPDAAASYALHQGLAWVSGRGTAATA